MLLRRVLFSLAVMAMTSGRAASAQTVSQPAAASAQRFPDVLSVKVKPVRAGVFDFDVTVSSPYDTPQRYADAFRVTTLDGKPIGERTLWHDHQDEQPFTRDLYGVSIPAGISKVRVQARDQKFGYGGKSVDIALPGR